MEHKLNVHDADNGKRVTITVEEGPTPYSVTLTFGSSYSITLSADDASDLATALAKVADFG